MAPSALKSKRGRSKRKPSDRAPAPVVEDEWDSPRFGVVDKEYLNAFVKFSTEKCDCGATKVQGEVRFNGLVPVVDFCCEGKGKHKNHFIIGKKVVNT